ncbi:MAG TPA: ABC transporter permease [Pyrinomonadaceae bacterium]|jgi:putative ABC transport system permease protein
MGTLWQDVRYAARALRKSPGFAAVAVLTLALGIGANTAIFSVVNAVLLRPLPYPQPEQLVSLYEDGDVQSRHVSYPNFLDWRKRNHSFSAVSTTRGWYLTLTGDGPPESLVSWMVSAEYFDVLGVRPLLGRSFLPDEDKPGAERVTVISYAFWRTHFGGDPAVLGRRVTLDHEPFTVVGVMPREFRPPEDPPLWVLMGQWTGQDNWMQRDVRVAGTVLGRLKPGVTIEQARADMAAVKADLVREYAWTNAGHTIRVVSLYEAEVGESRRALLLLTGAVALVLLIACANVANLLLARATVRRRELAVRAALGASRWRLMRQLLVESLLLAALGGALGLLLALWGVDLLRAAEPAGIPRAATINLDQRVLWFTLALSLLTGVVFGLAPAWTSARANLADVLKATTSAGGAGGRLRGLLVGTEIALALVLLVGAGLLGKSLVRLLEAKPGFEPEGVLTVALALPRQGYEEKEQVNRFHTELLARVAALPGVGAATVSNTLPGFGAWQSDIAVEGHAPVKPGEEINVDWSIVSERYFDVMRVPVLRGRTFTPEEVREGRPVVLVDENLARRFWPGGDALGKHIKYDSRTPHEIIGVVGNVRDFASEVPGRIRIYTPLCRANVRAVKLSLRPAAGASTQGLTAAVAREVHALDPDLPLREVASLAELYGREAGPRKFNAALLGLFAALALALAGVGIYGVTSYTVAQRTHELGVRVALGAQTGDVLRLVLGQGLRLALAGVGLGLLGAYALTRVLASLLYGVRPTDPLTYAGGALLLLAVALAACLVPARRATKVEPMIALRQE